MKRDIAPKDEADRLLRLCSEQGFTAAKWRIGAECGEDQDEWPGRTEEIIPTLSRALGDGIDKLVDANSGFSVPRAIEVGRMLEDNGIGHYEEPVPYWDLEATRKVTAALDIDVTGGEQDWDLSTWKRMIDMRAVDVVQPDIMYMGGLSRTLEVARFAAAAGLPCTPHAANLSLVTICTMHLLAAIPNAGKYLELSIEGDDYYPWQRDLFLGRPFEVVDGRVNVTDAPGWGVDISPAWLDRATYTEAAVESFRPSAYGALYHKGGKP
jgi:L-alanine-DL-glutamate epimerase-like enolase superfamily enzyme